MIKEELSNYVIYSWMYSKYNLKGLEKELFAIIYKSTKLYGCYSGSLNLLVSITGYSRQSIIPSLRKLVSAGLISKDKFNYKSVEVD